MINSIADEYNQDGNVLGFDFTVPVEKLRYYGVKAGDISLYTPHGI